MVAAPVLPAVRDERMNPLYNVSFAVPVGLATLDNAEISKLRRQAADLLAGRAAVALQQPVDQIVVRDLLPKTDFNMTNEVWLSASLTANTYVPLFTAVTLLSSQLVCFYGVMSLTPNSKLCGIKFSKGAQTLAIAQLEQMFGWSQSPVALIRPTVIYNPSDLVSISGYSSVTQTEEVVLLGFEAEVIGKNVAPNILSQSGG